eukprot:GHVR01132044.1.p1 GENE.GHVR01132044.1~~GHVR01132044.1.p1  ORF type:complete len:239 (-),score=85.28 GHVR01132044.1:211-927(-)
MMIATVPEDTPNGGGGGDDNDNNEYSESRNYLARLGGCVLLIVAYVFLLRVVQERNKTNVHTKTLGSEIRAEQPLSEVSYSDLPHSVFIATHFDISSLPYSPAIVSSFESNEESMHTFLYHSIGLTHKEDQKIPNSGSSGGSSSGSDGSNSSNNSSSIISGGGSYRGRRVVAHTLIRMDTIKNLDYITAAFPVCVGESICLIGVIISDYSVCHTNNMIHTSYNTHTHTQCCKLETHRD